MWLVKEDGQGDSQRRDGGRGGEQCVAVFSRHTHSDPRRRETVAQPGEMRAHLLFSRQGRQHHLARRRGLSSLPPKRVSLRLAELFDTEAKTTALPAGEFRLYRSPKHTCAFQAAAQTPGMLIRAECKVSEEQQARLKTSEASSRLLQRETLLFTSVLSLELSLKHDDGNSNSTVVLKI